MPSHSTRVQAAGLPDDYQFGDAGKRKPIVVPQRTLDILVDLTLSEQLGHGRCIHTMRATRREMCVAVGDTIFVSEDWSE